MTDNKKTISHATKSGKLSRRDFLEKSLVGMALAGTATLPAWASMSELHWADEFSSQKKPKKKVTKASARYRDSPNKGRQCSGCVHFTAPGDCDVVEGGVSPNGWCRHFKAKGAGSKSPGGTKS